MRKKRRTTTLTTSWNQNKNNKEDEIMKKDIVDQGTEIVKKKKGKPRGGNNWLTDAALNVEDGDNAKYIRLGLEIMNLPTVDLHDSDAVQERLGEYFTIYARYDTKPTVAGMAMALGVNRQRLWEIRSDVPDRNQALPQATRDSIKKAYSFMEQLWENYMQNGKINPVSGIFLGKNHYGMVDKQEYVVTPNVQQEADFDEKDIRKRYLIEGGEDDGETD